ncbi:unnamed protein product [Urochloa decumbens]|uniref:F-box domain-containing protein n=1 Tax=Urochloa decumbens TaxID=240449 RepID=A0ABC9F5J5_9POAL
MKPSPKLVPKRKRKGRAAAQPPTTIESLGDDVLSEILVRLPSPPLLGRAALACPRWLSLTTSGDFVRRFRALHPSPPLLGCFLYFGQGDLPAFHCTSSRFTSGDRNLAAVVRGGDFLLTGFGSHWYFKDCRDGLLLAASDSRSDELAVFDPMSRRRICLPPPYYSVDEHSDYDSDSDSVPDHCYDEYDPRYSVKCLLPSYGGSIDSASFRAVSLEFCTHERVRAHEYNSSTGKWRSHPWAPRSIEVPPPDECFDCLFDPTMHAVGRVYWKWKKGNRNVLLALDTESMQFSYVALPPLPSPSHKLKSYVLGETEDGACCLVCVVSPPRSHCTLQLWLRNEEVGSWELQRLDEESCACLCGYSKDDLYNVAAVTAGIVLLHADNRYRAYRIIKRKPTSRATVLEDEAAFYGSLGCAYPYLMEWPLPSLSLYSKLKN